MEGLDSENFMVGVDSGVACVVLCIFISGKVAKQTHSKQHSYT